MMSMRNTGYWWNNWFLIHQSKDLFSFETNWKHIYWLDWVCRQLNTRSLRNKNVALSCLFMCSLRTFGEWHVTEMVYWTYPLMRSLPQVVFTAVFLKCPTPVVVCLYILSATLELCSSVSATESRAEFFKHCHFRFY